MSYIITKEAYNVVNTRLPDMVYSKSLDNTQVRFAHYFERYFTPIEYDTLDKAIKSLYPDNCYLYNPNNGQVYLKDSETFEIYESAYRIIEIKNHE